MAQPKRPGFPRAALKERYDVRSFSEDSWHSHSGNVTQNIIQHFLVKTRAGNANLLNAGSGIYQITSNKEWHEYKADLFHTPLIGENLSVCARVEALPFCDDAFGCVICVGEVLGYCDPAKALAEFSRVTGDNGILIADFGNSRSTKYRFTKTFGRAADIATDRYNETPERIWVYSPEYILSLVSSLGWNIYKVYGTHFLSAMGRKAGIPDNMSLSLERILGRRISVAKMCDIVTFIAVRGEVLRSRV